MGNDLMNVVNIFMHKAMAYPELLVYKRVGTEQVVCSKCTLWSSSSRGHCCDLLLLLYWMKLMLFGTTQIDIIMEKRLESPTIRYLWAITIWRAAHFIQSQSRDAVAAWTKNEQSSGAIETLVLMTAPTHDETRQFVWQSNKFNKGLDLVNSLSIKTPDTKLKVYALKTNCREMTLRWSRDYATMQQIEVLGRQRRVNR